MKDIDELRAELCKLFDGIKSEAINHKQAKEMNNAAGKIINSLKVQLEYAHLRKESPNIDFLETTDKKK